VTDEQERDVDLMAKGFVIGYEAARQQLSAEGILHSFHGMVLHYYPGVDARDDNEIGGVARAAVMKARRELRDGSLL